MIDNSELIERLRASDLLPADMEFLVDEAADAIEAADRRIAELEKFPGFKNYRALHEENERLRERIAELEADLAECCNQIVAELGGTCETAYGVSQGIAQLVFFIQGKDKRIAELETREENLMLHNDELASLGLKLGFENETLEAECLLLRKVAGLDKDND